MARNNEFGNRIRNWHTQKRPFDLGGFSLCSVKMFIWTVQIMYIWGGGLGGGYFRNRSLGGRKKVVREKFVNNRKKAHFFTGVNQNKRGGWRGRGRRRRSSKRRRRTIPHSNMIISLPYDNFLKSVICLFVTGVIIKLQRMPSK